MGLQHVPSGYQSIVDEYPQERGRQADELERSGPGADLLGFGRQLSAAQKSHEVEAGKGYFIDI